jgi:hypothetical protein
MSLRFDHLIPGTLRLRVLCYPGFDGFGSGALHGLFGALNDDEELFHHVFIRPMPAATFDGEAWTYRIAEAHITLETTSASIEAVEEFATRSKTLLTATRDYFTDRDEARGMRYLMPDRILLSATVPEDQHKDVGSIVRSKALGRIKADHYALLPGDVHGAGLRLIGATDHYEWNVTVAPSLDRSDDLYVSADLDFPLPDDPPTEDIAHLVGAIRTAADFLEDHALAFASAVLPERKKSGENG